MTRGRTAMSLVIGVILALTMTASWADTASSAAAHSRQPTDKNPASHRPKRHTNDRWTPSRPAAANRVDQGRPAPVATPTSAAAPTAAPASTAAAAAPPAGPTPSTSPAEGPAGSLRLTGTAGVALTFDDGPDPFYTPQLLDLLAAHGVKATFCLVGFRVRDNPAIVRRIVAEGHTLCSHSWQHLFDLGHRSTRYIAQDLRATNDAIRAAAPAAQIRYFRAPGGNFTPRLVAAARGLGMTSIYWHVDTRDWDRQAYGRGTSMSRHVVSVVKEQTRPGSIILSHDLDKPDTVAAFRTLLPWLSDRFTLVATI